jgi:hypothetical protein
MVSKLLGALAQPLPMTFLIFRGPTNWDRPQCHSSAMSAAALITKPASDKAADTVTSYVINNGECSLVKLVNSLVSSGGGGTTFDQTQRYLISFILVKI